MSYTKLLGLEEEISDCEIIKRMKEKNLVIEDVTITQKEIGIDGVSGDFGGPM